MKLNMLLIFLVSLKCQIFTQQFDTTFAQGIGYVTTPTGVQLNCIKLQNDGKIVSAGSYNKQFYITRYKGYGTIDETFGDSGSTTTPIAIDNNQASILAIALQQDNKIVVCGYETGLNQKIVIARYKTNGQLDETFGNLGIIRKLIDNNCRAQDLAIDSNNNIIVVGTSISDSSNIIVLKYNNLGGLDTNFGDLGIVKKRIGVRSTANAVVIDNNDNIIVAGGAIYSGPSENCSNTNRFMICKFDSSGNLYNAFGNNGVVVTKIGNNCEISDVVIDSNSNIVVSGYSNSGLDSLTLARYTATGHLDTNFNDTGIVTQASNTIKFSNIVLDDLNNIYVSGNSTLSKYDESGNLVSTFGNSGILTTDIGNQISLSLDANKQIFGVGTTIPTILSELGSINSVIARFNKDNINFVSIANLTNNAKIRQKIISFSGTSSGNNSKISIFLDDQVFDSALITDNAGNWSSNIYSSVLDEGEHVVVVKLLDEEDNVIVGSSINFTIDTKTVSSYATGNEIRVDALFGDDNKGVRSGAPFATINKALSVAQPGDTVRIAPGVYQESFTVPNYVSLRGTSAGTCIIAKNVSTDTDLVTMGEYCVLEDLTLQLTSSEHVQLRGVVFPGTSTITSALRGLRIRVNNTNASANGSSNVYGIHAIGTGKPSETVMSAIEISLNVTSNGNGNKRGILVDTAGGFNIGISIICVKGEGNGTYIGVETNHPDAVFESDVCLIEGSTADISQTQGYIELFSTDLENLNTNGLGITTEFTTGLMTFADMGTINSGIRYLCPGTYTAMLSEVPFNLSTRFLVKAINVNLLNAPGTGKSVTVTLRKNGADTLSTVTLNNNQTSGSNTTNTVQFVPGDKISVSVYGSENNNASNIIVTLELY